MPDTEVTGRFGCPGAAPGPAILLDVAMAAWPIGMSSSTSRGYLLFLTAPEAGDNPTAFRGEASSNIRKSSSPVGVFSESPPVLFCILAAPGVPEDVFAAAPASINPSVLLYRAAATVLRPAAGAEVGRFLSLRSIGCRTASREAAEGTGVPLPTFAFCLILVASTTKLSKRGECCGFFSRITDPLRMVAL